VLKLTAADLKKETIETLVIPVCEDKDIYDDLSISALIKLTKKVKEFKGRSDDELILYNLPKVGSKRIIFMGLGKLAKVDRSALRALAGRAVKKCIQKDISEVMIAVPCSKKIKLEMLSILEPMLEGACLGNHRFDKYKKEKKHTPLKTIRLLVKPGILKTFKKLPSRVMSICEGTVLARDWVSMPPNDKTPPQLAQSIVAHFRKCKLDVHVLEEKELKRKKFGGILTVAAGSQSKPKMVVGVYSPDGAKKTVALVGKGVTFDSGGINLKSTASLEDMKMDMSGAAAVAATLIAVTKLKPKIKVVGIIPIVENMPSGNAARPGDIIKSYDGKTIEIGNTDAEGRLILIDGMSYAIGKYAPQTLIDLATLTGACVVALGEKIAGVFSFDDELAETIVQSGVKTHERCWRMPLPVDYKETLKSDFADIKNISSSRWGGAITAALFLSEFVGDTRWAHIDIAGPAYIKKENAYCGPGGTGFGVRLLCDLLEKL
jgi:leucyl aminopeptidase